MKVSTGFFSRDGVGSDRARVTPTEAWGIRLQAPPRRWRFGASDARPCGGTRASLRVPTGGTAN